MHENLHSIIIDLFKQRDFTHDDITNFFSWDLLSIPDITKLQDMEKTAERVISALSNNEEIGIYGDYDVDGTTSCALFYHFFQMFKKEVQIFQPSRFIEGYGIHLSSIDHAISKGVKLLITVDCGITAGEVADYAKERGLDLIITDHHEDILKDLPNAYSVVNPNRRDESDDNLKTLAGVGVAFAVCLKVKQLLESRKEICPSIYPLLQFVAIGTICDIAKLNTLNIRLTRHGLKQITSSTYPGIRSFFTNEERARGYIPSDKISFNVGPMINAKGRLDHAKIALDLLTTDNYDHAFRFYNHLEICNNERKKIQSEIFKEAKEQIISSFMGDEHVISIVYGPSWHEGVIGIVASRLVEEFKVPAIVFSNSEQSGVIKGSARSVGNFDLFSFLNQQSDLFLKFGGHKAAAGLSMKKDNLTILKNNLIQNLKSIPLSLRTTQESFDLEIRANDVSATLAKQLEKLGPFGNGNELPIFRIKNIYLSSYKILKEVHVKWSFKSKDSSKTLQGISFNYLNRWNAYTPEQIYKDQDENDGVTIYFTIGINYFNGNEYIQLFIKKIT